MQNYMTIQDMQYENFFPNKTKGVNVFSFILAKSINFHLEINHSQYYAESISISIKML